MAVVAALAALTLPAKDELRQAYIYGVTDKTNALSYAVGEEVVFTLSLRGAKELPKVPLWLEWSREGDDGEWASGKEAQGASHGYVMPEAPSWNVQGKPCLRLSDQQIRKSRKEPLQ